MCDLDDRIVMAQDQLDGAARQVSKLKQWATHPPLKAACEKALVEAMRKRDLWVNHLQVLLHEKYGK